MSKTNIRRRLIMLKTKLRLNKEVGVEKWNINTKKKNGGMSSSIGGPFVVGQSIEIYMGNQSNSGRRGIDQT